MTQHIFVQHGMIHTIEKLKGRNIENEGFNNVCLHL